MRIKIVLLFVLLGCLPQTVGAACLLTDVTSSGFGSIDGSSDPGVRPIGSMSVSCDGPYRIGLDAGMWLSETRRMSDGAGRYVSYKLWQDSSARKEWGDLGLATTTYQERALSGRGARTRNSATYPIYGTISIPGSIPAGEYSDTVQVILSYPPYGPEDRETLSLQISLRVTGSCSVDAGGVHGFGTWPAGGQEPGGVSLGSVSVNCPAGVYYAVGMNAGFYYDGSRRRMSDGSGFVPYVLRAGSPTGEEWGDTGLSAFDEAYGETYPAPPVYGTADGNVRTYSVWGDALTTGIAPGTYSDTVSITVVW